jgi:type I restriction-modification system DNA methylase subunit
MKIEDIIKHAREREYMSGIERDKVRVKATGEVFTPTTLVQEVLDNLDQRIFSDPKKTVLDNCCGDGQFLSEILIRKIENGSTFEEALSTIYGVDIMIDNVDLCRERLLCGREDLRHIVEQNIQCKDALKYGYNFKPMGPARRKTEENARARQARLQAKQEKQALLEEKKKKKEAHQKKIGLENLPPPVKQVKIKKEKLNPIDLPKITI